ncbi:hypothetical protein ACLOJK_014093 [Asimina triloba]
MPDPTSSSPASPAVADSLPDQPVRSAIGHHLCYRFMAALHSRRNKGHRCRIPVIDQQSRPPLVSIADDNPMFMESMADGRFPYMLARCHGRQQPALPDHQS